jgi:hypothetical protein
MTGMPYETSLATPAAITRIGHARLQPLIMRRQFANTTIGVFPTGEDSAPASNRNRPLSQTGSAQGPARISLFETLFPLAGFRGTSSLEIWKAEPAPECGASSAFPPVERRERLMTVCPSEAGEVRLIVGIE